MPSSLDWEDFLQLATGTKRPADEPVPEELPATPAETTDEVRDAEEEIPEVRPTGHPQTGTD